MKLHHRLLLLPLALAALLVGCDDPVDPFGETTLGDFDPWAVSGVIGEVLQPFQLSGDANITIALVMLQFGLTEPDWDGTIPEQYLGSTVVYSLQEQAWVVDESRTDGPADGLRVIWYAMDSSGAVGVPLSEQGYIDITPGQLEGTDAVGIRIVRTSGTELVIADIIQGVRVVENAEVTVRELQLTGVYSNGERSADVSFVTLDSLEVASATRTYEYDLDVAGDAGTYGWHLTGAGDTVSGAHEDQLLIEVGQGGVATIFDFEGGGSNPSQLDGSGTLTHEGVLVANVELDESRISFTSPEGERFTQQATVALEELTGSMMANGGALALALLPLLSLI